MTKATIEEALLEVLREIQETSGRATGEITDRTQPITGLEGFDSLAGVEATVLLEQKLDCNLGVDSLFVSPTGKRALHVHEVVDLVAAILADGRAA